MFRIDSNKRINTDDIMSAIIGLNQQPCIFMMPDNFGATFADTTKDYWFCYPKYRVIGFFSREDAGIFKAKYNLVDKNFDEFMNDYNTLENRERIREAGSVKSWKQYFLSRYSFKELNDTYEKMYRLKKTEITVSYTTLTINDLKNEIDNRVAKNEERIKKMNAYDGVLKDVPTRTLLKIYKKHRLTYFYLTDKCVMVNGKSIPLQEIHDVLSFRENIKPA